MNSLHSTYFKDKTIRETILDGRQEDLERLFWMDIQDIPKT